MQLSPFFKQPIFWLVGVGVMLLLVLSLWYVKRPTDATGKSLILSGRAQRQVRQDLARQAAQRRQDSVRAAQAQTAAATLYGQGQQAEQNADHLRQQIHETSSTPPDTGAQQLQRALTDY